MSNLKQLGIAFVSYTGDYSDYVPSTPGWMDANVSWCAPSPCTINHGSTSSPSSNARQNPFNYYDAQYRRKGKVIADIDHDGFQSAFRTIALTRNDWTDNATMLAAWADKSKNYLKHAPIGAGMMLVSGHLPDARVFYCPSASGMPADIQSTYTGTVSFVGNSGGHTLAHWQQAGGFDADAMLYGDWRATILSVRTNVLSSNYAYRLVPITVTKVWHHEKQGIDGRIPGIRMPMHGRNGAPLFRTVKELGGRAMMSDTFSKGVTHDAMGRDLSSVNDGTAAADNDASRATVMGPTRLIVGMGAKAHRQTYNVLYGDGHVAGFGDPQEKIIWAAQGKGGSSNGIIARPVTDHRAQLASNYFYGGMSSGVFNGYEGPWADNVNYSMRSSGRIPERRGISSMAVWHDFDMAAGIDNW